MNIKLSKLDWENIGISMGWMKKAQQDPEHTYNDGMRHGEDFEEVDSEDEEDSEENLDFSYLTAGHEDDLKMMRLRQKAESLSNMYDDAGDVHVALYWLLSNYHGGQNSPEYAALSASPYSPGPMENGPRGEAKMIYKELISAYKAN
jgi:hypothetical protein